MLGAARGLTRVETQDLKKALAAVHRGHLLCPPTMENLARVGLQHCANELLALLRNVDEAGVRAVLVAVIAERQALERRKAPEARRESMTPREIDRDPNEPR